MLTALRCFTSGVVGSGSRAYKGPEPDHSNRGGMKGMRLVLKCMRIVCLFVSCFRTHAPDFIS